ncbi:hypothetical protein GCM10022295_62510 [Streptomyces osmaniensis]|uniref:Insertion element IS402-like domain-containing protein n=1 Tax=Streptomyces osmaniensis TaxID=593134 RepID=A0ABP6XTL1_9ACTN
MLRGGDHARRKPWEVSDELWAVIEPLLPKHERRYRYPGRKRIDDRKTLQGVLFVLYTGVQWEYPPQELGFGSGPTCWRRLAEWQEAGVWEELQRVLLDGLRAADRLDFSRPGPRPVGRRVRHRLAPRPPPLTDPLGSPRRHARCRPSARPLHDACSQASGFLKGPVRGLGRPGLRNDSIANWQTRLDRYCRTTPVRSSAGSMHDELAEVAGPEFWAGVGIGKTHHHHSW